MVRIRPNYLKIFMIKVKIDLIGQNKPIKIKLPYWSERAYLDKIELSGYNKPIWFKIDLICQNKHI